MSDFNAPNGTNDCMNEETTQLERRIYASQQCIRWTKTVYMSVHNYIQVCLNLLEGGICLKGPLLCSSRWHESVEGT